MHFNHINLLFTASALQAQLKLWEKKGKTKKLKPQEHRFPRLKTKMLDVKIKSGLTDKGTTDVAYVSSTVG